MWFEEFKTIFKWLESDERNIRNPFESKRSIALKNALYKERSNENLGTWINSDMLDQLKAKWATPNWQHASTKNQQNRLFKEGHNKHSGGSISEHENAKRMQMNRETTCFELYGRLHTPKGKPNEWFSPNKERFVEIYKKRIAEKKSQSGEGTNESFSQQSDNMIYLEVVGGVSTKGWVYGLGSQAADVIASSSTAPTFHTTSTTSDMVHMQEEIDVLKAKLKQKDKSEKLMKRKMEKWEDMMKHIVSSCNLKGMPYEFSSEEASDEEEIDGTDDD